MSDKFEEVKSIQQDTKILQQIIGEAMKGKKDGMVINVLTIGVIQIGAVQHDGRSAHLLTSKEKNHPLLEQKLLKQISSRDTKFSRIGGARVEEVMRNHKGKVAHAAKELGVNSSTLVRWLGNLGLKKESFRSRTFQHLKEGAEQSG